MEYTSSSQSSSSSLSQKEQFSHFEFNVTSPILKSKKNRKKKIGKFVDQIKKFKKQAPKIHDDTHAIKSNDIDYHSSNYRISFFDTKETADEVANTTGTEFFVFEGPTYKSNYSENHQHHKFLSKIKKYHSSHLHLITSMIQSDDGEEEDEDELEEGDVKAQRQRPRQVPHRGYLKMTRPTKKYFKKKKKPKDQASVYSFSSVSSSTTTTTSSHKRKRLHIHLTNKRKRQQNRKKKPIAIPAAAAAAAVEQEKKSSLIQIRHQMMDFKIPADWTCISSKVNKNPKSTNFKIIRDTTLLDTKISNEIKRIETSRSVIEDYIHRIEQLNMDMEHHFNLFSSRDTKSKEMEQSSIDLRKSRQLLQQAYNRHVRLTVKTKNTMNPSIRLENLQIKVQSLHKSDFLGLVVLKHVRRWAFSFVLFCVMCISFLYIKKNQQ
ncbi:hypothetical protein PS15p_205184 [Mucor circinelloides]